MSRSAARSPLAVAVSLALMLNAIAAGSASAHVKWFCAYDVAEQPVGLKSVLNSDFEFLTGLSVLALMAGGVLEITPIGAAILRALDRATRLVRENIETFFRAGCAFFFISIWAVGGILLTPELKSDSLTIGAIQLGIAAGMVSRRTMPLSALGICSLYAVATWEYGAFHLADYPIFLGIAAYLALVGCQADFFGKRPIDILRWSVGVTLMWASIEKWAYPQWSYPLFIIHPNILLRFNQEFYMLASGAIEFALAFALLWTPLVRRAAAAMLAGTFVSAVVDFGKIDLIGHSLIVVALVSIIVDDGGKSAQLRDSWLLPVGYAAALVLFLATYYTAHAGLFGTSIL